MTRRIRAQRLAGILVAGLVASAALIALLLWLMLPPPIERDPPRDLPWTLPDYRAANTQREVDKDGLIHASVEHFYLPNITPAMVAWFYQVLPTATVEMKGTIYPLYHLFHPTEHGRIRVQHPAASGLPGMTQGATIYREEWFGPYDSRGAALMTEFSDQGMLALAKFGGITIGEIRHSYREVDGGTQYRVDAVIGSRLPLLGSAINYLLRTWVFHPDMIRQWQRHQIEEVSSLNFFLPQIYAQRHHKSPFYVL